MVLSLYPVSKPCVCIIDARTGEMIHKWNGFVGPETFVDKCEFPFFVIFSVG